MEIGADRLFFQCLDDLVSAVRGSGKVESFDCSVFDGHYVTDISDAYLEALGRQRSDSAKSDHTEMTVGVDLYNTA